MEKKILVIQLARLGDIFLSWPVVNAVRRNNPDAKIDMLVRPKFSQACFGLDCDEIIKLPTEEFLFNIIDNTQMGIQSFQNWIKMLQAENYTEVYNLTFSPLSSYITYFLENENCKINGYSRFADGYLNIKDETSSFFYAQAGEWGFNRIHLTNLFANVCNIKLCDEDWNYFSDKLIKENRIGVHLGASQSQKTLTAQQWTKLINEFLEKNEKEIVLFGNSKEAGKAKEVCTYINKKNLIKNIVGKTTIVDLFRIIYSCDLIVGGDSSLTHISSLTKTPNLQVTLPCVNFWETGPKSPKSRVVMYNTNEDITKISFELESMLNNLPSEFSEIEVTNYTDSYKIVKSDIDSDFIWQMIEGIYFNKDFPKAPELLLSIQKIKEANEVAFININNLKSSPKDRTSSLLLDQIDEVFKTVGRLTPEVLPIINWYFTEKSRIGPAEINEIINKTEFVHLKLQEKLTKFEYLSMEKVG